MRQIKAQEIVDKVSAGVIKMRQVNKHLEEKLKNPYFKELYELEEQKLDMAKCIIDYRIQNNLTQGQLAKKTGAKSKECGIIPQQNNRVSPIVSAREE